MTLSQAFDRAGERYAERPLVITDTRTHTYQSMGAWSTRLASGLVACGVRAGENVAVVLGNFPEYVAVKLAIARIGATAVPINYLLRRSELHYVLAQSDSTALITMDRLRDLDYLAELDAISPQWRTYGGGERLPKLRNVFVYTTTPGGDASAWTLQDLEGLATADNGREIERRQMQTNPGACSDIIYTSGTTGKSKGVTLTHDMVLRTAYASAYTRAFEDGRRILFALPLYHVFGYVECLVACMFVGGAIVPLVGFDAEEMVIAAQQHRVTEIVCVPTMTLKMLEVVRKRGFDSAHLIAFFNSGGISPPTLWSDIRKHFGAAEVLTGYGMTETTASTTCTLPEDPEDRLLRTNGRLKQAGSAGDAALGGVLARYKTIDPQTGEDLPVGVPGELMVRGPVVTAGYYNKTQETSEAFTNGWLHTGDIGVIDSDDYLTLLGRIKESYRCGGEMVMPGEVEEVLSQHPLVKQALVVGVRDDKMGEVGCACIIPSDRGVPDSQELISLCAARLARFKVPRHVLVLRVEEVPVTATGRPQKFKLAELARERIFQANGNERLDH